MGDEGWFQLCRACEVFGVFPEIWEMSFGNSGGAEMLRKGPV